MKKLASYLLIILIVVVAVPVSASELVLSFKTTVSDTYDSPTQQRPSSLSIHMLRPVYVWSDDPDNVADVAKNAGKLRDALYYSGELAIFGMIWVDVITTYAALNWDSHGKGYVKELNTVFEGIVRNRLGSFVFGAVVSTYAVYAFEHLRKNKSILGDVVAAVLIIFKGWVVYNNLHQLSKVW